MTPDEHAVLTNNWRHSVGAGWWATIERTHYKLFALDPNYRIDQIKEKYGGLRYYFTPSKGYDNDTYTAMEEIVSDAETECAELCEFCGSPGRIRGGESGFSWWKIACDECAEETHKRMTASRKEWEGE